MQALLSHRATLWALLAVLVVSYVLCVAVGLVFDWTIYQARLPLLPGFTWPLTVTGSLVRLLRVVMYNVYEAALIVLPYNAVLRQRAGAAPNGPGGRSWIDE